MAKDFQNTGQLGITTSLPNPAGAYTYSLWAKWTSFTAFDCLWSFQNAGGEYHFWALDDNRRLYFETNDGTLNTLTQLDLATWYFIAGTRSNLGVFNIWLNSVSLANSAYGTDVDTPTRMDCGGFGASSHRGDMQIAFPKFWNTDLNASQLAAEQVCAEHQLATDWYDDWYLAAGNYNGQNGHTWTVAGTVVDASNPPTSDVDFCSVSSIIPQAMAQYRRRRIA